MTSNEHDRTTIADRRINRREALLGAGAAGLGLGVSWLAARGGPGGLVLPGPAEAASCTLSKELTEGPYWVENALTRRDITEGKDGTPLRLRLIVRDADSCRVIPRADVELWHADATGEYSGVNGAATRFLRGHQKANAYGVATFDTIDPGWYRGRTPHIHLKVHVGGDAVHTGQLFFRDALSQAGLRDRRLLEPRQRRHDERERHDLRPRLAAHRAPARRGLPGHQDPDRRGVSPAHLRAVARPVRPRLPVTAR